MKRGRMFGLLMLLCLRFGLLGSAQALEFAAHYGAVEFSSAEWAGKMSLDGEVLDLYEMAPHELLYKRGILRTTRIVVSYAQAQGRALTRGAVRFDAGAEYFQQYGYGENTYWSYYFDPEDVGQYRLVEIWDEGEAAPLRFALRCSGLPEIPLQFGRVTFDEAKPEGSLILEGREVSVYAMPPYAFLHKIGIIPQTHITVYFADVSGGTATRGAVRFDRDGEYFSNATGFGDEIEWYYYFDPEDVGIYRLIEITDRTGEEPVRFLMHCVAQDEGVAGFSDVHTEDYYAEAVSWAVGRQPRVTGGVGNGKFAPLGTVTRAQAVTFLWNAAGQPEPASLTSPFSDVTDAGAWYYRAVLWAAEQNITSGIGGGKFGLDLTLPYDQIFAFLCKASGDSLSGGDWSDAAVRWAASQGLTEGLLFRPKDACPRCDVVYCLWRQLGI